MKVKIISSQKSTFWYADKIGQCFFVDDYDYRSYQVTPNGGLIRIYDCKILSHTECGQSETIIPETILKTINRLCALIKL